MYFKNSVLSTAIILAITTLTACGDSDNDDNVAPSDISLSNSSVLENSAGALVGTLSATDENTADTFTFSVSDARFVVAGDELSLGADIAFDFETEQSVDIDVVVTDSSSLTFTKTLTIDVTDALDTYAFESKFVTGESSVSYTGQIARHALIAELTHYIGNVLQTELDDGTLSTRADVLSKLNSYYRTTDIQYDNFELTFTEAKQQYITDISSSSKNLNGKMAGNDATGQHKDWNNGEFDGWNTDTAISPEGLIDVFFGQLADNAEVSLSGAIRQSVTGDEINKVYLNTDGTDLKQLIQKFLLVGVTYSQAADDYLGHETDGKGLTTDNIGQDGDSKPYSTLEHQFDEGFGYFGATVDYLAYSDTEIAGKVTSDEDGRSDWNGKHDSNGDGEIDLTSEMIFGIASNAAKRDLNTADNTSPTDYTAQIMNAFLEGRKIINDNVGSALSSQQLDDLLVQRDIIVDGWERALATTVVHYINELHSDLNEFGTDDFNYEDAAKHYSELKGFALGLQFNPYSKITDEQFVEFHTLVKDKPVLDTAANVTAYQADLLEAREIIATALSLNTENVENW